MECVIFIGIQATGKSTFFRERFSRTHVHISLDILKTRYRERRFVELCIETQQPFVVDNTNPSLSDRARYLEMAKSAGIRVTGYYFRSAIADSIKRNDLRSPLQRIPELGIRGTHARLQLPKKGEGFDELYYVNLLSPNGFQVEKWNDEI